MAAAEGDSATFCSGLAHPSVKGVEKLHAQGHTDILPVVEADPQARTVAVSPTTLPLPRRAVEDHQLLDPSVTQGLELVGAEMTRAIDSKTGLR